MFIRGEKMATIILLTILCTCELIRLALDIVMMTSKFREPKGAPVSSQKPTVDPAELARQRKRFDDEMAAFQQMMNYNSDVAYGITPEEN